MVLTPSGLLAPILLGVIALVVLLVAMYLLARSARKPVTAVATPGGPALAPISPRHARQRRAVLLVLGIGMLASVFLGRGLVSLIRSPGSDEPQGEFGPVSKRLRSPSGGDLAVEESGPQGAPRLIFTHGWGGDRREWAWARRRLATRFRVVTWDLPGLGQSSPNPMGDYDLNHMAADLRAVIEATGTEPAILVGHSIGGMINLTLFKQLSGSPGPPIAGLVELNTTYTNPVETTKGNKTHEALQKPVYEPLLHLITAVSPVVRGLNWLGYQSGLIHLYMASSSFAGNESRQQLDFASRYYYRSSPAVVARGMLAMLNWDASDILPRIAVPVLIVSADQDTTTLPEASDHMASKIPQSLRYSVAGAAHLGPIEQNDRYNNVIETFAMSRLQGERQASREADPPASAPAR